MMINYYKHFLTRESQDLIDYWYCRNTIFYWLILEIQTIVHLCCNELINHLKLIITKKKLVTFQFVPFDSNIK